MDTAHTKLGIPIILAPQDMASNQLDELSCLTYISYFIRTTEAPGTQATLRVVREKVPEIAINNFTVSISK